MGHTTTFVGVGATVETAEITDGSVTYAKIQNVSATDKVLGRSSAGAGDAEEIACTAAGRAVLDDANAAAQVATLGLDGHSQNTDTLTIDHGAAATDVLVNVCYGTGAAPAANTTTIGALYIKYTA